MVKLKYTEMRVVDDAMVMNSGYVLGFSDRTFAEFFDDEFNINIYQEQYAFKGSSKAKHLRAFIEVEDGQTVGRVLRRLWEERESIPAYRNTDDFEAHKLRLFKLIPRIESSTDAPRLDAVDRFASDVTLEELVSSIERDIAARKPVAALDRLHTYCMKKFGHLLTEHGVSWDRSEPLHSRVGKYVKALEGSYPLKDISKQIIKGSISIFERFNYVRNNDSLAHDNILIDENEAHFIFDSVVTILRFVKRTEAGRFGL